MNTFTEVVEEVKALTFQEKEELQKLIKKYLIEERREEIYQNCIQGLAELKAGKLEFSSDTVTLKRMLND